MKIFLMLLLLQVFPEQVVVEEHYTPKTLPRDQWYEVAHIIDGNTKSCINQYLAPNFQKSHWKVVKKDIDEECREEGGELLIDKNESEIFKFHKKANGIEIILTQNQREVWNWNLWNFKKRSFLKIGEPIAIKKEIEDGLLCEHYNIRCEALVNENCRSCLNGHIAVVGSGCSMHTRVCGSSCGGRNQVACSQGLVSEDSAINLVCPHQKRGAICHKGLSAYCYNNIVYCK